MIEADGGPVHAVAKEHIEERAYQEDGVCDGHGEIDELVAQEGVLLAHLGQALGLLRPDAQEVSREAHGEQKCQTAGECEAHARVENVAVEREQADREYVQRLEVEDGQHVAQEELGQRCGEQEAVVHRVEYLQQANIHLPN